MLPLVKTPTKQLDNYKGIVPDSLLSEIKSLAKSLRGKKVSIVNSTPRGGGVAEILKSLVPLMKGAGLRAEWYTIPPKGEFFKITKKIHNALQGKEYTLLFWEKVKYLQHIERSALLMKDMRSDIWVIHDPQPAGVIMYVPHFHPSVSHIHIDLTRPNRETWNFISRFLGMYDKIIFTSRDFVQKEVSEKAVVFPPAIDIFVPKNRTMPLNTAKEILKSYGIDTSKPLISQVSRFDPWKGWLELVDAFLIAKKKIPDLQLAMVGFSLALDDPESIEVFKQVSEKIKKIQDIHIFYDAGMLGSLKVDTFCNVIQTASDIVLQNSRREGFALTVTEAMWKAKAVIGGNVGGIKLQIKNGKNGFLSSTPQETAKRIVQLIKNPKLAEKLGKEAQKTVKEKFLIPRLLRDYLKVFKGLV